MAPKIAGLSASNSSGGFALSRPQLRMRMTDYSKLPPVEMAEGYEWRTYREGDEQGWLGIVNSCGMGPSTVEEVRRTLTATERFLPEGMFFAVTQGEAVSTATGYPAEKGSTASGQLHMVATKPEHRGKGLAKALSLAVVHFFAQRGFGEVYLWTDDWRVPALKMYVRMGFEPSYYEGADEARWAAVLASLQTG